jgi:hypothetical protein
MDSETNVAMVSILTYVGCRPTLLCQSGPFWGSHLHTGPVNACHCRHVSVFDGPYDGILIKIVQTAHTVTQVSMRPHCYCPQVLDTSSSHLDIFCDASCL